MRTLEEFLEQKLFFLSGVFNHGRRGNGGDHLLFHSTTSAHWWKFRHLLVTLHVRWLSHIFDRAACLYQTATRWYLPPLPPDRWWKVNFYLFTWWFGTRFVLQQFWHGKSVDSNSHRLSLLYYKRTN